MLIDLNDAKVTRAILRRHNEIREGLQALEPLKQKERGFFLAMCRLFYQDKLKKFEVWRDKMPESVYTHALCCYRALFRRAIRKEE